MRDLITHEAVLDLEHRRCEAMLAGDSVALEALQSEALVYVHSTGTRDTRSSYLRKIRGGAMRYLRLQWTELQVQVLPGAALVTGRMDATVLKDWQEKPVRSAFLTVWVAEPTPAGGIAWRLRAHQGTPLPSDD